MFPPPFFSLGDNKEMDRIRGEESDTEVSPDLKTVYSRPSHVHFNRCTTGGTDGHC
jgi:hypothetical protein